MIPPQIKGRKLPPVRPCSLTDVMDTNEAENTTRLFLGQALANWVEVSSIPVTHLGQAGRDLSYITVYYPPVREFDTFRPVLGVQTCHAQFASVAAFSTAPHNHTHIEKKR